MLLEPDESVLDALEILLNSQGWIISKTKDHLSLEELLRLQAVSVVISEAALPFCEAKTILKICKKLDVPVIFTGSEVSAQHAVDLIKQGALDYLEKPFAHTRLIKLLNGLVNRHNDANIFKED